jgi:hypothetical protein
VTEVQGEEHFVHAGGVLLPNHPVVKARRELFEAGVATRKPTRRRWLEAPSDMDGARSMYGSRGRSCEAPRQDVPLRVASSKARSRPRPLRILVRGVRQPW